jgi:hypothetical protein
MSDEATSKASNRPAIIGAIGLIVATIIGGIFQYGCNSRNPAKTTAQIEAEKPHSSPYSGVVVDEDGKPVSGATVEVDLDQETPVPYATDSLGTFHLQIPANISSMHLSVYKDGFQPVSLPDSPRRTGPEIIVLKQQSRDTIEPPRRKKESEHFPLSSPIATAPIIQTTTAPCTAQSVGGSANVAGCNPSNPYKAVTTWTPDGLRITRDGNNEDVYGPFKEPVFSMLNRLELGDDWKGILTWSRAQQQAYPDWFTPDYVAGTAEAKLCELPKARSDLDKFLHETTDATSYASLHDKAQRLRNELDLPREGLMCPSIK